MRWFTKTEEKLENVSEPAPIAPEPPIDRAQQAFAEMRVAKEVLDSIAEEIKTFRREHGITVNAFNQIKTCLVKPGRSKRELDLCNAALEKRLGRALHAFSATQKIWSEVKNETQFSKYSLISWKSIATGRRCTTRCVF